MDSSGPVTGIGRLLNRVATVTGAGRGIGRAVALRLGFEGATVVAASRTSSEVRETVAILRARGCRALAVTADVSDWSSAQDLVAQTVGEFGDIHILVNCAGVQGPIGPLADNNVAEWISTIQINLLGTFFCCKAVLPRMIEQRYGKIINLSGGGATAPRPNFSAYAASKAAVVRLTETLAEEVREYGISVSAIAPGAVNTRMLDEVLSSGLAAGEQAFAEARRQFETGGSPPEMAASLVTFLASSDSNGLTGKVISALHDGWQNWDAGRIAEVMSDPWYTLRRMDPFTLQPLVNKLRDFGD